MLFGGQDGFNGGAVFLEQVIGFGFETQDDGGLGVAGANEAPAAGEEDAGAVGRVDGVGLAEVGGDAIDDGELGLVGSFQTQFGSGDGGGETGKMATEGVAGVRYDFEQTASGVEGIVEAMVAVGEEHVAGEFTGE